MIARWVLLTVLLWGAHQAQAGNTLGYRGPHGTGIFPAEGLARQWPEQGPPLLWKYNIGIGFAGATVAEGKVYVVGGEVAQLFVFTLEGQLLERIPLGPASWKRFSGTRSTPVVIGQTAVATTPNADIYGVDLRTNTIRWKRNSWTDFGSGKGGMGWGLPSSPLVAGENLILNACSRDDQTPPLVAINVHTGKTVWEADPEKDRKFSAADTSGAVFEHNGRAIVAYPCWRSFLVLDAQTGRKLWEFADPKGSEKKLVPIYGDGYLLTCPTGDLSRMVKLSADGSSCEPLWERQYRGEFSQGVILNRRLYIFGNPADPTVLLPKAETASPAAPPAAKPKAGNAILCLDAQTGRVLSAVPAAGAGHIIAADGLVFAVELLGKTSCRVTLLEPTAEGMKVVGRFTPPLTAEDLNVKEVEWQASACPVVAEGRLFLRFGPLLVFELRPGKMAEIRQRQENLARITAGLKSPEPVQRIAALAELKTLGWQAGGAAEPVSTLLTDPDAKARQLAVEVITGIGPAAVPGLVQALTNEQVWKEGQAAAALVAVLGAKNLSAALVQAAEANSALREPVKTLLPKRGAEAVPELARLLGAADKRFRWWALELIRATGPEGSAALEPLIQVTKIGDPWFRELAALTLGGMGPNAAPAVPALVALLTDDFPGARAASAQALGQIGVATPQVLEPLQTAAKNADPKVAEAAQTALKRLEGK